MQPSTAPSSADVSSPGYDSRRIGSRSTKGWIWEAFSILLLLAMVAYFLKVSWRKWPDPIVDSGPQLYAIWQTSEGAEPYHDFAWNYGPFSLLFNAALFKLFGPGLMVLVTANLVFYAAILCLGYLAFRKAWGKLGAFAAMAVFISVFSFSHLLGVGNYNFVMPYAAEASHGILLSLAALFIVVKWCDGPSRKLAFLLGLCGGISAVMKPEFMLATGALGFAAMLLRWVQRNPVGIGEIMCIAAGLVLPTIAFTLMFVRREPLNEAFIDASTAWWLVFTQVPSSGQQAGFVGVNHLHDNLMKEVIWTAGAMGLMTMLWVMGWVVNQMKSAIYLLGDALYVLGLAAFLIFKWMRDPEWFGMVNKGWVSVGWCLPGLIGLVLLVLLVRLVKEWRPSRHVSQRTLFAVMLSLLAMTMLARMVFFPRIYHFGFFQAAIAGMVVAAVIVSDLPRWTGEGVLGRMITGACSLFVLGWCCSAVAAKSNSIRVNQTEAIGEGRDRFYSTTRLIDGTGALVNWAAVRMEAVPKHAQVLVLPEGAMINYLSRRQSPSFPRRRLQEKQFVEVLKEERPEYVILISRDLKEFGVTRYGKPGDPGEYLVPWVGENYKSTQWIGGDPLDPDGRVGCVILERKDAVKPGGTADSVGQ